MRPRPIRDDERKGEAEDMEGKAGDAGAGDGSNGVLLSFRGVNQGIEEEENEDDDEDEGKGGAL